MKEFVLHSKSGLVRPQIKGKRQQHVVDMATLKFSQPGCRSRQLEVRECLLLNLNAIILFAHWSRKQRGTKFPPGDWLRHRWRSLTHTHTEGPSPVCLTHSPESYWTSRTEEKEFLWFYSPDFVIYSEDLRIKNRVKQQCLLRSHRLPVRVVLLTG